MMRTMAMAACVLMLLGSAPALADTPLAGVLNRRFMLVSEDGAYSMRLTGRVHFKAQFPTSGPADAASDQYFQLRRIRTGVEGMLAQYYEYKVEYDFGRNTATLTDGYLGLTHVDAANLRMGRFKAPFSVEELTSSNSIRFVERSMLNRFAPSRQVGVALHGRSGDFGYNAMIYDGAVKGEHVFAGRATLDVGKATVGVNALTEDNAGSASLIDFRTELGTRWYGYHTDLVSDGRRSQLGGDVSYWGTPLSLVAEFVMGDQDVVLEDASKSLSHTGWYVQAGYVLTGENATVGGVTPARDFDPAKGGAGAFELVARYAQVKTDDAAMDFARDGSIKDASALTAGVNWYMSRHTKLMLNYVHTSFESAIGGDKSEGGVLVRMQLNY